MENVYITDKKFLPDAHKCIAIYGGSFNPSTQAHRDIGLMILGQIPVDEVWYLVSPQNPFKAKHGMARFEDRVAMARLNVAGHTRLVVQDIEAEYARTKATGIIETADTLRCLTRDFPNYRFIWTMGADNFATFHTWGAGAHQIADNHPIVVIPRHGFTAAAHGSPSATFIPRLSTARDMRTAKGWFMLDADANDINATHCRHELATGNAPTNMRPKVTHYALTHRVYASLKP